MKRLGEVGRCGEPDPPSYLHEVVQKAIDVHSDVGKNVNALRAAYGVCHDFCCGMMLEILHSQAQKLSAKVGGLWASQLLVQFDKVAQVLDLCLWQREFCTGIGGTGRDVGVGGSLAIDGVHHRVMGRTAEGMGAVSSLPTPTGCRYMRIHRPTGGIGQIVVMLGPVTEGSSSHEVEDEAIGVHDDQVDFSEERVAGAGALSGLMEVQPDSLSCGQMLLAAARTFAARKITALANDLEHLTRELGISPPCVGLAGGITCSIYPLGGGVIEVSVDVRSGRFVVQDTLSGTSKFMARYFSRLSEALNLLPSTDTHGVSANIVEILSTKASSTVAARARDEFGRRTEDNDLRQQQVRRCMIECIGLLRREEVEQVLRSAFGMSPCQRWQALLGRAGTPFADIGNDSFRTFVCLDEFREEGVRMSREWRHRGQRGRLRRRDPGVIELTTAERAATAGPHATVGLPDGLHHTGEDSMSSNLELPSEWSPDYGGLRGLAASLGVSDGDDHYGGKISRPAVTRESLPEKNSKAPPTGTKAVHETSELVLFFLEVVVSGSIGAEYNLLVATLPTRSAVASLVRPQVSETYQIRSCPPCASSCASLEVALLPNLENDSPLHKRTSRRESTCDEEGWNGTQGVDFGGPPSHCSSPEAFHHVKRRALGSLSGGIYAVPETDSAGPLSHCVASSELARVHEAVQIGRGLVPFARLQHALMQVGTGISLDLHSISQLSAVIKQPSQCTVILGGEDGWSKGELAAVSARVHFYPAHTRANQWEWRVLLASTTLLPCYAPTGISNDHEQRAIFEHLPLVEHVGVAADQSAEGVHNTIEPNSVGVLGFDDGEYKSLSLRFPPSFSVHAMCRSFALSGEGFAVMSYLVSQAAHLSQANTDHEGYVLGSFSPVHIALRNASNEHVILLTHSAFSASSISSCARPGLVLIPQSDISTCPVALHELEASVRKHRDLRAIMHGLSRTVPLLAVVADIVPDVGRRANSRNAHENHHEGARRQFVLTAVSPACFVLSVREKKHMLQTKTALTLLVEACDRVRVSGRGRKEVAVNAVDFRELLVEWVATASDVVSNATT